ncbi:hypothetical protein B0I35DRAFT_450261 [Stachybotrys elegans]|uniref:Phospholipase D n=1 Tax=Stachybotrys elegans TaxID=80388 RepID=A0A8K0SWC1_9HYPO|nr:hypothetical protein B0I35DRAFT_450261 [Stachybotrys elegans]
MRFLLPLLTSSLPSGNDPSPDVYNIAAAPGDIHCSNSTQAKPFYAIAHRVLETISVADALKNGANALEIDMHAWPEGWYADHDGSLTSRGARAEDLFMYIAKQRREGQNIIFVWLDIKSPDFSDDKGTRNSIEGLQHLSRVILEPEGIRVMYGFYSDGLTGRAFNVLRDNLNDNEALNVEGDAEFVKKIFDNGGPSDKRKRVMSKGLFNPWLNFGDCSGDGSGICPQLRLAARSGNFNKVFGWTIAAANTAQARKLMSEADVDGLIYGFVMTYYYDHKDTRKAFQILADWLAENRDRRCLATIENPPW